MSPSDALIIGGGHNGLIAALYLAKAGWKTAPFDRNERVGGAVTSAEGTMPGFIHDLCSTNQNLFLLAPWSARRRPLDSWRCVVLGTGAIWSCSFNSGWALFSLGALLECLPLSSVNVTGHFIRIERR